MTIQRWRTARMTKRCTFCRAPIKPGERYVASALPPGDDLVGNTTWLHVASHGVDGDACEQYWRVDPYRDVFEADHITSGERS